MKEFFRRTPKHFTPAERDNGQQIPDNMWAKCPACGELIYTKQLNDNLKVCKCGHHMRLTARERLDMLDSDSFCEEDGDLTPLDPLGFVSAKDVYTQKLKENQERTGLNDALISGHGTIEGYPLQIAVSEFAFIGGSMGSVYGERLARAAERAAARGVPLLTITATGGARQHEGAHSAGRRRPTAYCPAGGPLLRWHHCLLCVGRRCDNRRARRADRVCRPARDRADHPPKAAGQFSDRRIYARTWDDR
jgi:acetyl-CoA carboxylase carboxyl transferase beta subunit